MSINKQLGGVTDFIRTAETQPGNQATDLEFTNTPINMKTIIAHIIIEIDLRIFFINL